MPAHSLTVIFNVAADDTAQASATLTGSLTAALDGQDVTVDDVAVVPARWSGTGDRPPLIMRARLTLQAPDTATAAQIIAQALSGSSGALADAGVQLREPVTIP